MAIVVTRSGNVGDMPQVSSELSLDLSNLEDEGVNTFLADVGKVNEKVRTITLVRSPLSPKYYISILSLILQDRHFRYLDNLDLSYVNLPEICLNYLCEFVNPFSGGYNISRLNVSRCNLGKYGTPKLLTALFANNTLTQLLLTGNHCEDVSIPTLVIALTKYTNQINTIGLGANKLTSTGLKLLLPVLEIPQQGLHTLFLGNNPTLGDTLIEELFVALNKGGCITTLGLSNCNIQECDWTRYLPFMSKLETLDLSYNNIDDNNFGKLCKALEKCYCLKHLDIGHNKFGGIKCNVIEQMLAANGALVSLSLCGNRCDDAVWDAIHRGLLENGTLLQLSLTECNITLPNAHILCQAFAENDICTIDLENNPLPEETIRHPREYFLSYTSARHAKQVEAGKSVMQDAPKVCLLNERAHPLSLERSLQWCTIRTKEIALSLTSLSIVADRTPHIPALNSPDGGAYPALQSPTRSPSKSSSLRPQNTAGSASPSTGVLIDPSALHASTRTPPKPRAAPAVSITSPELIAQSDSYLSPSALQALVTASDLANASETRLVHVGYGRAPLVIGCVEISSLTTYAQVHILVEPLVREYVSTIAANEEVYQDLVRKYRMVDPEGKTLSAEDYKLRRVWPEFCKQADPVLVVRPGNWVQL